MIGCDLILITEMNEETPYESCEYADGSVLSYAKYAMEDIPDFKDGEEKVYSDFAVGAESSKTFVDIPSLAAVGDGYDTLNSALVSARRAGVEIIRNESTLICEFRHKSKGRCRYTSLKNIKAILDILNEYGFMGISFDIMRTPENLLMMYSALFRSTTPPVREGATGCGG